MWFNLFSLESQKPIGGDFSLKRSKSSWFETPWHTGFGPICLMGSGRDALRALMRTWPYKSTVLLSAFSCDAVISALACRKDLTIHLVDIGTNLYPDVTSLRRESEKDDQHKIVLVGNLFGLPYPPILMDFLSDATSWGVSIIEDRTHNLCNDIGFASDTWFASVRKWIPSPGLGIYSATDTNSLVDAPTTRFSLLLTLRYLIMRLIGVFLYRPKIRDFLVSMLRKSDVKLGSSRILIGNAFGASARIDQLEFLNFMEIRRQNASHFLRCLGTTPQLELLGAQVPYSPYSLTFSCRNYRDELREYLRNRSIFAPVLWPVPEEYKLVYPNAYSLSKTVISIPIDQRYSVNDMERIAIVINDFFSKVSAG